MSSKLPHWAVFLIALAACGGDDTAPGTLPIGAGGAGGSWAVAPSAGAPAAGSGGAPLSASTAGSSVPAAGSPAAGSGGVAGTLAPGHSPDHPAAGSGGAGGAGGMAGMMAQAQNHCKLHASPDPRDEMLTGEPLTMNVGAEKDLLVPQLVLNWMGEQQFAEAHDGWHLVRKWDQTCRKSNATTCTAANRLVSQGLSRAPIQQGAPGDGLAFMMMHRHMIQMLKTTFPKHADLFSSFKKVPRTKDHPENPMPWRNISWTSNNIKGFDILENIEQNLSQFPTEDDLGTYIQNTYRWTEQSPMSPVNQPGSGLHGALHAQWAINGSPANLIQQAVDVKNHIFWKLHGWIDDVWERYRVAKNMKQDDPAYQKLLLEQCMEMYMLQPRNRGMTQTPGGPAAGSGGAGATETGMFATMVRPILDSTCAGCHSAIAPSAGMTLGGAGVTSAEVMQGLVGIKATNGEYALIEPGMPQKSWLYLKVSGGAATATCSSACDRETMPPSGTGLGAAQITTIRQWIENGATAK